MSLSTSPAARLPAPTFELIPLELAEAAEQIQELAARLGDRGDLVRGALELRTGETTRAILLAWIDLRRLFASAGESAISAHKEQIIPFERLQGESLPFLVELLEEDEFYRVFRAGDELKTIGALLSPEFFRELCEANQARYYGGELSVTEEVLRLSLTSIVEQFRSFDTDYLIHRFGQPEPVAVVLSAQRYVRLFERRLDQGVLCPDCGKRSCKGWPGLAQAVRERNVDYEAADVPEILAELIDDVSTEGNRYVLGRRGRPSAVVLPLVDWKQLRATPASALISTADITG